MERVWMAVKLEVCTNENTALVDPCGDVRVV